MVKVAKIMVCGAKSVGKTSLIEQLIYGNINKDSVLHPTIEDIYIAYIDTGKAAPRDLIRIFDTGGLQGNNGQVIIVFQGSMDNL